MTSIRIPASVTTFGNNAFDGIPSCPPQSSLQQAAILYYGSQAVYNQFYTTYGFANTINYVNTTIFALTFSPALNTTTYPSLTVSGCTFTTSDYGVTYTTTTNPASLTGFNTTPYQRNLVSVTNTPSSVTSIEIRAFQDCILLTSVTIPSSVTSIGNSAFEGCYELNNVNLPTNLTVMGYVAFRYCTSLTSIILPSSLSSINDSVFEECSLLKTATISVNLTNISNNLFSFCSSLESVIFPDNSQLTSIGFRAFYSCVSLNTITITSALKVITSTAAFQGISTPSILYTTVANYPPNNLDLTNQFTYTYLIGTVPTKYFTIQSNQTKDLVDVFAALTSTSAAPTKFLVENYNNTGVTKDLNQIFEAYQSGSQASATNFLVENYNGSGVTKDLNLIFKPL